MNPKIVALLGSPLIEGNTAKLLQYAVKGAEKCGADVEVLPVPQMDFSPCMEFNFCRDHTTCMIEDEVTSLYGKFREMDGMIIATPVMTMGIPGHLKSFMDRFQVFYNAKYERKEPLVSKEKRKKRKTLFISISGMNVPYNFDGVKLTAHAFCDILDCQYGDELLVRDMDHKRDLMLFPGILEEAEKKGQKLAEELSG